MVYGDDMACHDGCQPSMAVRGTEEPYASVCHRRDRIRGSAVESELLIQGHDVLGPARSHVADTTLKAAEAIRAAGHRERRHRSGRRRGAPWRHRASRRRPGWVWRASLAGAATTHRPWRGRPRLLAADHRLRPQYGVSGYADEGIPFLDIATAIGQHLTLPVVAATHEQVSKRFSFLAPFIDVDNPTSSALTIERLRWKPDQISLLGEIEHDNYFQRQT